MKPRLFIFTLLLLTALPCAARAGAPVYVCKIAAEYPHSPETFTQGLFIYQGKLYESSGRYGKSFIAQVDLKTGRHIRKLPIPRRYFAEGMAPYGTSLYLLTWKSGTGFVHSLDTLERQDSFDYRPYGSTSQGWGLTHDGTHFIRSSGEATLSVHDSKDFTLLRTIPVRDAGKPIPMLNELEYVNGMVFANIWKQDRIAIIDPTIGEVHAWLALCPLRDHITPNSGRANGIAYDEQNKKLYVTGKNWNKLFEITIDPNWWN